jgi:uncharacterized phiE125 gp8 family phage protein
MRYSTTLSVAPTVEPVSVAEMMGGDDDGPQGYMKIPNDAQNLRVAEMIKVARQTAERYTQRQFVTATWKMLFDAFPGSCGAIELPYPPLQSITSITYYDAAGDLQTLDASTYQVDIYHEPGMVQPEPDETWPDTELDRLNAVTITFKAGYGDAGTDVPEPLRMAVRMGAAHLYEHREDPIEVALKEIPGLLSVKHALIQYDARPAF